MRSITFIGPLFQGQGVVKFSHLRLYHKGLCLGMVDYGKQEQLLTNVLESIIGSVMLLSFSIEDSHLSLSFCRDRVLASA